MSKTVNISDSVTLYPSSFDSTNSSYAAVVDNYPIENGYTDSSSSTAARFNITTGSNANTYIYYNFNTSSIPAGATITSVTCQAKVYINTTNSSRITTRQVQLCSGTTTKGSAYTFSNSTTAFTVTAGSWTRAELENIKIRTYVKRGTSNTTTTYYVAFYGATLTVNYSISGTAYTVTAASSVNGISASPATQDIMSGEDATIRIDGNNIDDITVTDNDVDITSELIRHTIEPGGTVSTDLGSYSLVSGSFNGSGATYFQGIVGNGVDASKTTSNYYSGGSGIIAVFTYDMAFTNIPSNATITRVYCEVNGHAESTSNSSEYMCAQLISGSTDISEELNFKNVGTSNSTQTLEATTIPTIAQLANLKLQCRLGYYGGAINGATCYVVYTIPSSNPYYWTYTITNIDDDHTILIEEAGVFIPPEEDPEYTYWPITISSINATTDPNTGTTRVIQGTNQTITISPSDPQLTLALDNGVDITSQLSGGVPNNTYTVSNYAPGASYGFNLNSSTGYYVSTNNGVSKSASVARLNMDFESSCLVTIQYINYAEANYDYGMFGKLDTTVATDGLTASSNSSSPSDSTSNYQLAMCSNSSSTQTITYNVPAGEHYIDIKYGKDDASDSNNDSLQWKVLSVESTSAGGDYTYTLTNITQKHSLIFVFGNVSYYFITSSGTNCKIFPDGQQVKLEGDNYKINIIPNNINDTVSITDNNIDRTTLLERTDGVDKNNNPAVSYQYNLTNIQAAHNLIITSSSSGATDTLYFKNNNNWVQVIHLFIKQDNRWVEQNLSYLSDNNITQLRKIST